ncbi:MAG: radical SAM/SPASM family putative metalloenzyme maturase [Spirochaetes bacterium]|nr:MAG: radical SAM/SPASM family putative metalloenzyme maturase [Spirochaetota bacterium]
MTMDNENARAGGNAPAALKDHPARLFVEVTTRCNLRCGMCVKQSGGGNIAQGDLSEAHFRALEPAFPRLEGLVLSGIGEPLLHPGLEEFVARAKSLMPSHGRVGFQTNGILLAAERARALMRSGVDRVCVSADSVAPGASCAASGLHPTDAMKAVEILVDAARREGRGDFQAGIEFVAMRENLMELPRVLEGAARRGIRFALVTQLLPYDAPMVRHAAYDTNTDAALEFYERWEECAAARATDISLYFRALGRYSRTPAEAGVLRLAKEMVDEAAAQGVSLNIKSLLARDGAMLARTREAFAEARACAERYGIELTLPETVPHSARRCDFVEEGSVFVSWDGKVHPCHFLWHRFTCYLGGVMNTVKPFVFGDLGESPIIDIWNAGEFASFRKGVLRYDFPFCYDCSLALCDLVQTEDFEQDCHISPVPCAACLWCTGLFNCMR